MKKGFSIYQVVVTVVILFLTTDCKKEETAKKEEPAKLAVLSTIPATNFTTITAASGGNITSDGGSEILTNGVCWSTTANPVITDSKTVDAVGSDTFVSSLSGLAAGTTYHVRAYATNSAGTAYGADMICTSYSGSVTDEEGNDYYTIAIGVQLWMAENLKTTRYSNGDLIGTTTPATLDITKEATPKYQWAQDGDESNVAVYGRLYTWDAVTDSRNVCPTGWHVPTDAEWTNLTTFLGGEGEAGGKLKESGKTHWSGRYTGTTNETGFTALPGGSRFYYYDGEALVGPFSGLGHGSWWSSTENSTSDAYGRNISSANEVFRYSHDKWEGLSVRCVKDN
jgi:uncharacterized protein (TIGR02145 family)